MKAIDRRSNLSKGNTGWAANYRALLYMRACRLGMTRVAGESTCS